MVIKRTKGIEGFYEFLKLPFERDYKSTYSIFYVNKENLFLSSEVRKFLSNSLEECILELSPSDFIVQWKNFKNCEDILYVNILDSNNNIRATIYIRNSGTEDKTSLVMKADFHMQDLMKKIFDSIFPLIFSSLKNKDNSFFKIEKIFMEMVEKGIYSEDIMAEKLDESIKEVIDLKQISKNAISGGLVGSKENKFFLTELGESFLEKF